MASFGDFAKKQKKKLSKEEQAKKMNRAPVSSYTVPEPLVISKKRKDVSF